MGEEQAAASGTSIASGGPAVVNAAASGGQKLLKQSSTKKMTGNTTVDNMNRVIFPDHPWIKVWDLIVLTCLYLLTFILPYQIGVSGGYGLLTSIAWLVINVLINAVFFVDTFLYFFRAYRTKDGQLVFNLRKIQRRYLRGLFIPNFISVLPFTIVFYFAGTTFLNNPDDMNKQSKNFLNFILFAGFLKLIRLVRVKTILQSSDVVTDFRLKRNSQMLLLFKYILMLVIISHWFACIWCFVAFLESRSFNDSMLETPNWIGAWYEGNYVPGGPDPIGVDRAIDRYVLALFWAIQTITSIGYGNISPITVAEWWVGCILQLMAGILWAYFIGGLVGVAAGMNESDDEYNNRSDQANALIRHFQDPKIATRKSKETEDKLRVSKLLSPLEQSENLNSKAVAKRIRRFIHQQYQISPATSSINSMEDIFPVLETLPPELQMMSTVLVLQRQLETVPYLSSRYLSIEDQCHVATSCKFLEFSSGEVVKLNEFELGQGVFVILHGCAFAVRNDKFKPLRDKFLLITAGSAFDAGKALLDKSHPASRGVLQFLTFATVIFIPRSTIDDALAKNGRAWKDCGRWIYLKTILLDGEKKEPEDAV